MVLLVGFGVLIRDDRCIGARDQGVRRLQFSAWRTEAVYTPSALKFVAQHSSEICWARPWGQKDRVHMYC